MVLNYVQFAFCLDERNLQNFVQKLHFMNDENKFLSKDQFIYCNDVHGKFEFCKHNLQAFELEAECRQRHGKS